MPHGIYAVRYARPDGSVHDGVASYGRRPTFDDGAPLLETFLFDFSGDLYGEAGLVDVDRHSSARRGTLRQRRRRWSPRWTRTRSTRARCWSATPPGVHLDATGDEQPVCGHVQLGPGTARAERLPLAQGLGLEAAAMMRVFLLPARIIGPASR